MRFVTVRDLRGRPSQVWRQLSRFKEMVLTLNGKPIAIISSTSEETLEENLAEVRKAQALAALDSIRRESVRRGLDKMSMEEIDVIIGKARKEQRREGRR